MDQHFNTLRPAMPDQIVLASIGWPRFSAEHPGATNLTIGVVADPVTMRPYQPPVVERAYQTALDQLNRDGDHGYQSPAGNLGFLTEFGRFAFGTEYYEANKADILAFQTMGGTGALWMADELLSELVLRDETGRVPMLLEPGYVNHGAIFEQFNIATYPHVDLTTGAYNHAAALEAVSAMPPYSVLLLQVCGHNDDGADRTKEQWDELLDAAQNRNAVIVLDGAYMGLARGLADDTYALTQCAERRLLTIACLSGSKIFGAYGERLGAMYILNARQHLGDTQFDALDTAFRGKVRQTITGVPVLVARAGTIALQDQEYIPELEATRQRIHSNRIAFSAAAGGMVVGAATGWGLYSRARSGGFTEGQVAMLNDQGLYVLQSSRVNYGGMRDPEQARWIGSVYANVLSAA